MDDQPHGVLAPETANGHTVDVNAITHRFGSFLAVDNVSLSIEAGEIVALLGPSGCGKTTLLRIIAGFLRQSAGSVAIDGKAIDDLAANKRNVGIVFQNYALFPHMTVAQNVAYGLRARRRPSAEVKEKVGHFLDVVQLGHLAARLPRELSGGQQQRVALARALVVEPSVLLLDEPFSALDKSLRLDMQIELKRLQRQFGLTAILVTHDQDEAMGVADRIAVMNRGSVEQFDEPVTVYDQPQTQFVSGFVGTTNPLAGVVTDTIEDALAIQLDVGSTISVRTKRRFRPGAKVVVSVRPEQLTFCSEPADGAWRVTRTLSVPIGANAIHEVTAQDGTKLKLMEARLAALSSGDKAGWCCIRSEARPAVFPAEDGSETRTRKQGE